MKNPGLASKGVAESGPAILKAAGCLLLGLLLAAIIPAMAAAQEEPTPGVEAGGYLIHQSVEFGGHITDFSGSGDIWSTFVDVHDGPRLLSQSLDMHAMEHTGLLFDDLSIYSFGYGGDPEAATRLRISKGGWYDFNGSFRRDHNYWNYDLLANPLNPDAANNPAFPVDTRVLFSPHGFKTVRRMTDLNLTLLPESRIRFRLGYSHNISEGPSLSSFHEGTDILLFQRWLNTTDSYRIGADFRMLPKTNISYDQFLVSYKGDNAWEDGVFASETAGLWPFYQLPDGRPVDLGLPLDPGSNAPCPAPLTDRTTDPPTANTACNGYLLYNRSGPIRTFYPTEQVSIQSRIIPRVDFSGRFAYSSADMDVDAFNELFAGRVTRTNQILFGILGTDHGKRVSANADLGVTIRVTDSFHVVDTFRWADFRIPGTFGMAELSLFGTTLLDASNLLNAPPDPEVCIADPTSCLGPTTHSNSSPADLSLETFSRFLGQDSKTNTIELQYDFTRRAGARLGYRYRNRSIELREAEASALTFFPDRVRRGACGDATIPLNADGTCDVSEVLFHQHQHETREHSLLLGLWARPVDELRMSFDVELMSANFDESVINSEMLFDNTGALVSEEGESFVSRNAFTRISPRNLQRYKGRIAYRPVRGVDLSASVNWLEKRNNVPTVENLQHYRNWGFAAVVAPKENFAVDAAYTYNDTFSQTDICFPVNPQPAHAITCTLQGASFSSGVSIYDSKTHFFSGSVMVKPISRFTANLGYTVTVVDGEAPILDQIGGVPLLINELVPIGPLQSVYQQPAIRLAYQLHPNWTARAGWNYYHYNEDSEPGPTLTRDARGSVVTLGIRYSF